MAATVNTSANAALSPHASSGEAVGGPHTPPRRTNSGSARNSSPTWNRIVRGAETEGFGAPPPPPPESLVTAVVPPAAEVGYEQRCVQVKDGSSPEGSEVETQPEGADNGNGSKKAAWNKPYNAACETGLVMGAVSWPTLSESTKASPKPLSADSSKNPNDPPILAPQVATANVSTSLASPSSAPQKQMTSNPNQPSPNPNATQHHARPARQRSIKRNGVGNSSSSGDFAHQFPQPSLAGDTLHAGNSSLKTISGGVLIALVETMGMIMLLGMVAIEAEVTILSNVVTGGTIVVLIYVEMVLLVEGVIKTMEIRIGISLGVLMGETRWATTKSLSKRLCKTSIAWCCHIYSSTYTPLW